MTATDLIKVVSFVPGGEDLHPDQAAAARHALAERVTGVALAPDPVRRIVRPAVPAGSPDGMPVELAAQFGFATEYAAAELVWFAPAPDAPAPDASPAPDTGIGAAPEVVATEHVAIDRGEPSLLITAFTHAVPGMSRAEFQARYRELSELLAAGTGPAEHVCRYTQSAVLGDAPGPDGVGEIGFASIDDLMAFVTAPWLFDELLPIEAKFMDHSRSIQFVVRAPGTPVA